MDYIPERLDVVWIDFDPRVGREQSKRRPGLIFSDKIYNKASGLCLVCPIRSRSKGWPYDIPVSYQSMRGFIMSDQIHSFDWLQRRAVYITTLPVALYEEAKEKLLTIID